MDLNQDSRGLKEKILDEVNIKICNCENNIKREHDLFVNDFEHCQR